jgi:hypothetical protein
MFDPVLDELYPTAVSPRLYGSLKELIISSAIYIDRLIAGSMQDGKPGFE